MASPPLGNKLRGGRDPQSSPLTGIGVLVTRPAHQMAGLCQRIEDFGGHPIPFPVLEIHPPRDPAPLQALLAGIASVDVMLFVSANAVHGLFDHVPPGFKLPDSIRIGAVGPTSAKELERRGCVVALLPESEYSSDGLLALGDLSEVQDLHIAIISGEGGRKHLANTLDARGACVEQVPVYHRAPASTDPGILDREKTAGRLDLLIATSNEGLDSLLRIADLSQRPWLLEQPLVVVSERMGQHARNLGFAEITVAENATDQGITDALVQCRQRR